MIQFLLLSLVVLLTAFFVNSSREGRRQRQALDARRRIARTQARERSALRHWRTFCCQQAEQPGPHPSTPTYYGDLP